MYNVLVAVISGLLITVALIVILVIAIIVRWLFINDARDDFFRIRPVDPQDSDATSTGKDLKWAGFGLTNGNADGYIRRGSMEYSDNMTRRQDG